VQTIHTFDEETLNPFPDYLSGRIELFGRCGLAQPVLYHGSHHFFSTFRGQASILMGVHSVLRESLLSGDISFPGLD
jgi:hypothetical protein